MLTVSALIGVILVTMTVTSQECFEEGSQRTLKVKSKRFISQKMSKANFFNWCRGDIKGSVYDPKDREEFMALEFESGESVPLQDVWTDAAPRLRRKGIFKHGNGKGEPVIQPSTGKTIKARKRLQCMTYRDGHSQAEYIPRRCSFEAKGICITQQMYFSSYFRLTIDGGTNDDFLMMMDDEYCGNLQGRSLPNGGQTCLSSSHR